MSCGSPTWRGSNGSGSGSVVGRKEVEWGVSERMRETEINTLTHTHTLTHTNIHTYTYTYTYTYTSIHTPSCIENEPQKRGTFRAAHTGGIRSRSPGDIPSAHLWCRRC
jgi:hypothetical protein